MVAKTVLATRRQVSALLMARFFPSIINLILYYSNMQTKPFGAVISVNLNFRRATDGNTESHQLTGTCR